jgi:hypothetical protein
MPHKKLLNNTWLNPRPSPVFRILFMGVVAALVIGAAPAALASSSWTIVSSPSPAAGPGNLVAESCVSSSFCVAVGNFNDASGNDQTLIESWNGTAWSLVSSPDVGTVPNDLTGVACTSSSSCQAVGYSGVGSAVDQTLVESWDGTSWTIRPSPNSGPGSALNGISCIAANACIAVGRGSLSSTVAQTLVESWDGTSWRVEPSPNVGGNGNFLNAVSCVSASFCMASGDYATSGGYPMLTLSESWDGTTWSVVPTPNATVEESNSLDGVSCASASSCFAVGEYPKHVTGYVASTLIESWNGMKWKIVVSPNYARGNHLFGVSCTSSNKCQAVGQGIASTGGIRVLIESWNGAGWRISANPSRGTTSSLEGVSCLSANWCGAAGYSSGPKNIRTLTEFYG